MHTLKSKESESCEIVPAAFRCPRKLDPFPSSREIALPSEDLPVK